MFFVPLVIGRLFVVPGDSKSYSAIAVWCCGFAGLLAVIYFPALIGIYCGWTLTELVLIWLEGLCFLMIISVLRFLKSGRRGPEGTCIHLKQSLKAQIERLIVFFRNLTWTEICAFLLPAIHAGVTFFRMHVDDDDVAYIGAVTTSIDTNTLMYYDAVNGDRITDLTVNEMNRLVTSPQFAFYAALSKLTHVRPAVLCHTLMPPVLTLLFFACFLLVGNELFGGDRKKTGLFTVLTFLICMSSYFSVYTAGTFIMIRSWQGKAQIIGLIIPLVLYLYLRILGRRKIEPADGVLHAVLLTAACLLTSMGCVFVLGESLLLLIIALILLRDLKLLRNLLPAYLTPAIMLVLYFKLG